MKSQKVIDLFSHLAFLCLGIMAVALFKERLFADAAYYAFHTVNKGWFHVEHGRIVLGLSQVLPLIGYYLGLPLKALLVLWSFGHELFYYLLFLLIRYPLRDKSGALGLLLVHLIGQLWLYYSPMYEICYGAALALLFYSILRSDKHQDDKWLILMLLAQWLAMTSHPLNFLLIFLGGAYHYLQNGFQKRIHSIVISTFGLGAVIELLTFSEYEWSNVSQKFDADAGIHNLTDTAYLSKLAAFFTNYFPDLLILFGIGIVFLFLRKRIWQAILGCSLFMLVIIAVNNKASAVEFIRYFESMYNPIVFIGVFIFIYGFYQSLKGNARLIVSALVLLLVFGRIYWTWEYGKGLQNRMNQWERLVDYAQTLGHSKYIINNQNFEKNYSLANWANPIESVLLSAMDGKEQTISLITQNDYEYGLNQSKLKDSTFLFRRFEIKPYDFLNPRFFQLNQEPYASIHQADIPNELNQLKQAVSIKLFGSEVPEIAVGDTSLIEVVVKNTSNQALASSLDHKIYLSYHWYQDNELILWDGLRSPIEADVWHELVQDVKVAAPEVPGLYYLQFDVVIEGVSWFELKQQYAVKVIKAQL